MARKMKDSGIEWIGEIPADFSLYKLKYLLSSPLCYGANESGTLYSDILPRYIRITDISPNGTLKNSGMLSLDESSAQNYMLHEGDILLLGVVQLLEKVLSTITTMDVPPMLAI